MNRVIHDPSELDALPVGSVVRNLSRGITAERITDESGAIPGNSVRFPWGDLWSAGSHLVVLHDPSAPAHAPSVVSDAAGLGDRIGTLSARLAAVGFPTCTCHPGDDDSERCLPSPQDWRAEIERAALSSTTLTAAPSATRDEVARAIRSVTDRWDEPLDEVHDVPPVADALLARFTITPKEDR